jgi:hypothetical protein
MKITRTQKVVAFVFTACRCWMRWWHAWQHSRGIGAYRPYEFGEIPAGELVQFHADHKVPWCLVVGSGHRALIPVAAVGGSLCYVSLSNGGRINSVTYMRSYRYLDGTRCAQYVRMMKQETADQAADAAFKKVAWA